MKLSYILSIAAAAIIVFWGYSCYSNAQIKKAMVYVKEISSFIANNFVAAIRNLLFFAFPKKDVLHFHD